MLRTAFLTCEKSDTSIQEPRIMFFHVWAVWQVEFIFICLHWPWKAPFGEWSIIYLFIYLSFHSHRRAVAWRKCPLNSLLRPRIAAIFSWNRKESNKVTVKPGPGCWTFTNRGRTRESCSHQWWRWRVFPLWQKLPYHSRGRYKKMVTTALPCPPLIGKSLVTRPRFDREFIALFSVPRKNGGDS